MRTRAVGVAIVALSLMAITANAAKAGDKQAPCAEVTPASASEIDIEDLARLCTGENELLYHLDGHSGRAFASMVSGAGLNTDEPADLTAAISHLEELADVDSSGEVTVDETRSLVDLVTLGILEAQIASTFGFDREVILAATGLNEVELSTKESEYRKLASRAQELGFRLPGGPQVGR